MGKATLLDTIVLFKGISYSDMTYVLVLVEGKYYTDWMEDRY